MDTIASTLSNCPFNEAFTLKVEYATGSTPAYTCQTIRRYSDGATLYRMIYTISGDWTVWTNPATNYIGQVGVVWNNTYVNNLNGPNYFFRIGKLVIMHFSFGANDLPQWGIDSNKLCTLQGIIFAYTCDFLLADQNNGLCIGAQCRQGSGDIHFSTYNVKHTSAWFRGSAVAICDN